MVSMGNRAQRPCTHSASGHHHCHTPGASLMGTLVSIGTGSEEVNLAANIHSHFKADLSTQQSRDGRLRLPWYVMEAGRLYQC